jgi:hypothetical protein
MHSLHLQIFIIFDFFTLTLIIHLIKKSQSYKKSNNFDLDE